MLCRALLLLGFTLLPSSRLLGAVPDNRTTPQASAEIDRLVFGKLDQLGVRPAALCTDEIFVRRVFIDTIGTLPTPKETREFLANTSSEKRAALIDALLGRDEFNDLWANKWSDLLRVKAEFPINLWPNAAQAYHHWIRDAFRTAMPYDQFVRTLLTANGSNFRDAPVNFFRAVQSRDPVAFGRAAALNFMGARAERWPEQEQKNLSLFFSQISFKSTGEWKEDIVFYDSSKAPPAGTTVTFPDGSTAVLAAGKDPRERFADWLIRPDNPRFTQPIANRTWYWLLGRGIVHEPDDFRADNPPSNPELLVFLSFELTRSGWDLRHLFRIILNSRCYQLSSHPPTEAAPAAALFASYPLRRLDAEVLIDAINQITGTTEHYTSPIPEPFTFIPEDQRAIALPDGSIGSPFLELFGRPSRDQGLESERSNKLTALQRLHLLNSTHIRQKIDQGPKLQSLLKEAKSPADAIDSLYISILSRHPTREEQNSVMEHFRAAGIKGKQAGLDLAWALINSTEFLHKH